MADVCDRRRTRISATVYTGLLALVVIAPFETRAPLVQLPGQSISSVETVLLLVMAGWAVTLAGTRRLPEWSTAITVPWLVLLAGLTLSALASSVSAANGIRMVGRLAVSLAIVLLALNAVSTERRLVGVLTAAVVVGVVVAVLVLFDAYSVEPVVGWLSPFRESVAVLGGLVRASGPLQYPTVSSMVLEVMYALGLGLMFVMFDRGRRPMALLLAAALAVSSYAIVLTFTRAGLIAILSALALSGLLRWRQTGWDPSTAALVALAAVLPLQVGLSQPWEFFWLRATSEGQVGWYGASIDAPHRADFKTGGVSIITVTVTNTGRVTLDSSQTPSFRLSYHWLLADEDRVVVRGGTRTLFPDAVRPGQSVTLNARVRAPAEPGDFRLLWDVEYEHRLWFSAELDRSEYAITKATVSGDAVGRLGPLQDLPPPPSRLRPGRLQLWRAAAGLVADHPVLGVGPDNYRLSYGPYINLPQFDTRTHSNNLYLETLVGGGIVGAAAFTWLAWRVAGVARRVVRNARGRVLPGAGLGLAAALVAIAVHGVFDAFMNTTPTYVLIAITLGLVVASERLSSAGAHRV